jgi:hypothetical protein
MSYVAARIRSICMEMGRLRWSELPAIPQFHYISFGAPCPVKFVRRKTLALDTVGRISLWGASFPNIVALILSERGGGAEIDGACSIRRCRQGLFPRTATRHPLRLRSGMLRKQTERDY